MKRILFFIFTILTGLNSFSQAIAVDNTTYTVPQLVQNVLFGSGSPGSSCVGTVSNITWSTGSDASDGTSFGSTNGIGYFQNTNPNFPLTSGVVLTSGNALNASGPNNSILDDGDWPGDTDLFNYIDGLGIDPGLTDYHDATVLEFDFTPLTTTMSFDFLFASEEYGEYQCSYSDSFAFFLTNVTTGSTPTNLALVPSTSTPISVVTIRDGAYFTGFGTNCGSSNPTYFGNFNDATPAVAAAAATNFNGETVLMTATSAVIPNNLYHIKLVIADRNDHFYDSAVFLAGGSFDIGTTTDITGTGSQYGSQTDFSGVRAICSSEPIVVQAGSVQIPGATYAWTLNTTTPVGANSNLYTVTQAGTYGITITYAGGCQQTDTIIVEYIASLALGTPNDITQCSVPFNLTDNSSAILNGLTNPITFHHTLLQAQQLASPISNPTIYNGLDGEIIYAAVEDATTGCISTEQFSLHTDISLCIPPLTTGTPSDIVQYETTLGAGISVFDFTPQTAIIYGLNAPADYTVIYYPTLADANAGTNPITVINPFLNTSSPQRIYAVLSENINPANFAVTSFQLIVVALPIVSISASPVTVCTGSSATITFTGTPNAIVDYTVDGNPRQITLNGSGTNFDITPLLNISTVYNLVSATITTPAGTVTQPEVGMVTVTLTSPPTINTPTPYVVCDDSLNNDGLYCFDLTTKINEITGGNPNIVVNFYETTTSGVSQSSPYCNITPGLQTLDVRAHFIGAPTCLSTTSLNLVVNPIPLPNSVITDYELCDYNNPGDEIEVFNLGTKSVEIANGQVGVTVSYYATLADAQSQTNALPNLYPNVTNPQQIWINIRDNATGCNTTGSFNLIVNPLPVVTTAPTLFECSNGSSPTAEFDLTVNEGTVTNGVTGMIITYYNTLSDAQNGSPSLGSPSAYIGTDNEVVYLRVENIATGCYATTTQLLRVTQGPVAITPQPLHYCDPNNDGFGVFDLDSTINEITGSPLPILGVSVTFHETPTDALLGANPIASPYANIHINTQTIYVRVFYTLTGCANYVELQLIVDPTPVATEPDDYELCDYTGAVGYETFDLSTTIPQVLGSIDPSLNTVSFYTSQAAAESGTGNITNPTSYINGTINTETIYVRVETIATGCYDIVTLQLIVNPLPNAIQPNYPQYSLCDTTVAVGFESFDLASLVTPILLGQTGMDVSFYPSLADAQSNSNEITNLQYTNAIIYVQTLGIRITNHATGCYVISTMDIRVEPLPVLIPPTAPYTVCDDNQDGFANFDLASLLPGLLNGMTTYTITFHETLPDANSGANPISTTVPYFSINPFVQILYVRAQDNATGCYSILPIELNADPSPVAPVNLNPISVCDQDNNPQNAITGVDLTQQTTAVLSQQTGAVTDYTVTYYTSQGLAQAGGAPIIPDTNYIGSNLEMIWVRVEHNTTHCFNIGSFQLEINTPLLLTTPTPLSVCDVDANANDQHHAFDLTIKDTEINQGTGFAVTYYPSLLDAQNNTNVISATAALAYVNIPPAVQTLGVVVTTTAGCQSITTLDIRVLPIPTPNTNPRPLAPQCDDNNPGDMMEVFDLTVNAAYIANGDPNVSLHYFASQTDAAANTNELIPATAALVGANVWIRVENNRVDYQGNNCYVLVEQPLTVNPLPAIVQPLPSPYRVCDNDADGLAVFDLTNPLLATAILAAPELPADYTISYYLTAAGANPMTNTGETPLPNSYTNVTPSAQDIYIRVVNNATGCINGTGVLPLAVEPYATAAGPQTFNECDGYADPYDGVELIDLTTYAPAILNGQNPAVFLVSYYTTQADALAGTNALTLAQAQAYQTDADTDTIWVKVENSSNSITPFCNAITTIDITVERYPNPIINTANGVTTICVDFITNAVVRPLTLDSGIATPSDYTFEWFEGSSTTAIPGATGTTYTVDTASPAGATRDYTVTATSISSLACQTTSAAFPVVQSGQAVIPSGTIGYTVTNAFTSSQIITVLIDGYGAPDYEYSLDDGPRQSSNVFEDVNLGTHIIHVWDSKGGVAYSCEELIISDVQIIDYPHYFTPNGDGIHDTWNIVGLGGQPGAKIFIFDRYGKLLKQISSTGAGWDGTYNGHLMPSDDYWFTVDYIEQATAKQFKSHFAMKR